MTYLCSLYNKNLVGKSYYNLPYPLLTSAIHAAIQFVLSGILYRCSCATPGGRSYHKSLGSSSSAHAPSNSHPPHSTTQSDSTSSSTSDSLSRISPWMQAYLFHVVPCGYLLEVDTCLTRYSPLCNVELPLDSISVSQMLVSCILRSRFTRCASPRPPYGACSSPSCFVWNGRRYSILRLLWSSLREPS